MSRVVREREFDPSLHRILPNLRVEIRPESREHTGAYGSRVEDVSRRRIVLMSPSSRGKLVELGLGARVRIGFRNERGYFAFKSEVTSEDLAARIPHLAVAAPTKVAEIERRDFHRVEVLLPCHFNAVARPDDAHPGVVTNLSGAGCRFASPAPIPTDVTLDVHFRTPAGSVRMKGVAMHVKELETRDGMRRRAQVRWVDVDERMRDRVIEFVFDRERETIRTRDQDRGG